MPTVKLNANGHWVNCEITESGGRFDLRFPYDLWLKDEVKAMEGSRWKPSTKCWSVQRTQRNMFALKFLMGESLGNYDAPLILDPDPARDVLYSHQVKGLSFLKTRRRCVLAGDMGVGKTLMVFELIESTWVPADGPVWYVAPRSALESVKAEYALWGCTFEIEFMTYDAMRRRVAQWVEDVPVPRIIVYDESSCLKGHKSKRSEAALHLTNAQLVEHEDSICILMSGTTAPNDPTDWWMQCEVARPGYIREGDWFRFKKRYGYIEKVQIPGMHSFPKLVQWKDGKACVKCREIAERDAIGLPEELAKAMIMQVQPDCPFCKGTGKVEDEVSKLGKRLDKLVIKLKKKDCLDLPDKRFKIIQLQPSDSVLRAAYVIGQTAGHGGIALQKLRQLADGFQYQDDKSVIRGTTPKDAVLQELLSQHEEVGRFVVYAGFRESVEHVAALCQDFGWKPWVMYGGVTRCPDGMDFQQAYAHFQDKNADDKMVFVAHPQSGGMGLTLTRSPGIFYFSNSFNAQDRMQSEDRIHRIGMDANRGATIYDVYYLPTDEYVLDALKRKEDLQKMSMKDIQAILRG